MPKKKAPPTNMLREETRFGTRTFQGTELEMRNLAVDLMKADHDFQVKYVGRDAQMVLRLATISWETL